jgi:hypothetical protein
MLARRVIGLVLLCLIVGIVLAAFNVTPRSIVTDTIGTIRHLAELAVDLADWAVPYILLGAVVVVPVAIVSFLLGCARRRR